MKRTPSALYLFYWQLYWLFPYPLNSVKAVVKAVARAVEAAEDAVLLFLPSS